MPLQRHSALRSLSRDHHVALQLARGLQTRTSPLLHAQLPTEPNALAAHVCRFFQEELEPHFQAEEGVLMPAVAGKDVALDVLSQEIVAEHAELRALSAALANAPIEQVEFPSSRLRRIEQVAGELQEVGVLLDRFGQLLESHVRKEERSYYQRIQEVLEPQALDQLGLLLERHLKTPAAVCKI